MMPLTPEEEIQEEVQEIARAAHLEAARLAQYEPIFVRTHPKPEPPVLEEFEKSQYSFMKMKGIEAVVNLVAMVCGIIFSAIRTAGIFAIAEASLLATYSIDPFLRSSLSGLAGITLVGAIEGVLAGAGWIKGKNSGEVNTSWVPAITAGAISGLAGLVPSFELIQDGDLKTRVVGFIMWVLVLLSGPGIAYLIFVVTENTGHLHNAWVSELKEAQDNHDSNNRSKWKEYIESMRGWSADLENDYRQKGREIIYQEGKFVVRRQSKNGHEPQEPEQEKDPTVQPRVREWLEANSISPHTVGIKPGDLASPQQIAEAIGLRDKNGKVNSAPVRKALERLRKIMP